MKPTKEQIIEKRKEKILAKVEKYKDNLKQIDNFKNEIKSKAKPWFKLVYDRSEGAICWDQMSICDYDCVTVYYPTTENGIVYAPLEILWNPDLIKEKEEQLKETIERRKLREEAKERAIWERLNKKFGAESSL